MTLQITEMPETTVLWYVVWMRVCVFGDVWWRLTPLFWKWKCYQVCHLGIKVSDIVLSEPWCRLHAHTRTRETQYPFVSTTCHVLNVFILTDFKPGEDLFQPCIHYLNFNDLSLNFRCISAICPWFSAIFPNLWLLFQPFIHDFKLTFWIHIKNKLGTGSHHTNRC